MAKKSARKALRGRLVPLAGLAIVALGIGIVLGTRPPTAPQAPILPETDALLETARSLSERSAQETSPPKLAAKTLVIVIDDAGYNLGELAPFLALPFPLTIAVLPRLEYSAEAARRTLAAGKELILHQPMEAEGGQNPGPGAVMLDTTPRDDVDIIQENLDSLPGVVGMNNHMGSAVTRSPKLMAAVLDLAKHRGIYYLDSLTAPGTATARVALKGNMRYWERSVFLDNNPDRASILRSIEEGKKKAENGSPAVMIGHVWSSDLAETLQELYPQLVEEGFSLSTISRLMIEEADARSRR
jgi:polysaccharide deacetylase 2 family uncharacterized protein YibQ